MMWTKNLFGIIAIAALMFAYGAGTIHSCNKHPADAKAERFTPFAVYRGFEMFWHDDFPGVDWEQKVREDISMSIQLLSAATQPTTLVEANQQLGLLASQMNAYPVDKRKEVANGVRMCLRYGDMWALELSRYLASTDSGESFSFSANEKFLLDSIRNLYSIIEIDEMHNLADSVILQAKESPKERVLLAERLKSHIVTDKLTYRRYFPKLFQEEY